MKNEVPKKILIVEAQPSWQKLLKKMLSGRYELLMAENVNHAKNLIKQNEFSIVLIGLFSSLTAPQEEDLMRIRFLEFLETEYSDIPKIVIDSDIDSGHKTLTRGHFKKEELLTAINDAIENQIMEPQNCQDDSNVIDFLIITATIKEFDAVSSKFTNISQYDGDNRQRFVKVSAKYNKKIIKYCVVIACLLQMGPPQAAVKTLKWVRRWEPRNILLVGIAGGVKNKVDIGDIIVPEMIVDASVGKVTRTIQKPSIPRQFITIFKPFKECPYNLYCGKMPSVDDWLAYFSTEKLLQKSRSLTWNQVEKHINPGEKHINQERCPLKKTTPDFYCKGLVVSSCDKIEDEGLIKRYLKNLSEDYYNSINHPEIHNIEMCGFEMEACGVATALEDIEKKDLEHRPGFLMIRAISDFGGKDKGNEQEKCEDYALDVVASYTVAFLESGPVCPGKFINNLKNIDFLIITTLKEEFNALLSQFENNIQIDSTQFFIEIPTSDNDGTIYNVIVVCLNFLKKEIESTKVAIKTFSWVERWKPRNVLLVGIASGVQGRVNFGDIIIPKSIINVTQKTSKSFADEATDEADKYKYKYEYEIDEAAVSNLLDKSNIQSWNEHFKDQQSQKGIISILHCGGFMASFGENINDTKAIKFFKTVWENEWWGFEMEGGTIVSALKQTERKPNFMIIRAISDFGDENKDSDQKEWGQYACDAVASYTRAFLESGPVPPLKPNR